MQPEAEMCMCVIMYVSTCVCVYAGSGNAHADTISPRVLLSPRAQGSGVVPRGDVLTALW